MKKKEKKKKKKEKMQLGIEDQFTKTKEETETKEKHPRETSYKYTNVVTGVLEYFERKNYTFSFFFLLRSFCRRRVGKR